MESREKTKQEMESHHYALVGTVLANLGNYKGRGRSATPCESSSKQWFAGDRLDNQLYGTFLSNLNKKYPSESSQPEHTWAAKVLGCTSEELGVIANHQDDGQLLRVYNRLGDRVAFRSQWVETLGVNKILMELHTRRALTQALLSDPPAAGEAREGWLKALGTNEGDPCLSVFHQHGLCKALLLTIRDAAEDNIEAVSLAERCRFLPELYRCMPRVARLLAEYHAREAGSPDAETQVSRSWLKLMTQDEHNVLPAMLPVGNMSESFLHLLGLRSELPEIAKKGPFSLLPAHLSMAAHDELRRTVLYHSYNEEAQEWEHKVRRFPQSEPPSQPDERASYDRYQQWVKCFETGGCTDFSCYDGMKADDFLWTNDWVLQGDQAMHHAMHNVWFNSGCLCKDSKKQISLENTEHSANKGVPIDIKKFLLYLFQARDGTIPQHCHNNFQLLTQDVVEQDRKHKHRKTTACTSGGGQTLTISDGRQKRSRDASDSPERATQPSETPAPTVVEQKGSTPSRTAGRTTNSDSVHLGWTMKCGVPRCNRKISGIGWVPALHRCPSELLHNFVWAFASQKPMYAANFKNHDRCSDADKKCVFALALYAATKYLEDENTYRSVADEGRHLLQSSGQDWPRATESHSVVPYYATVDGQPKLDRFWSATEYGMTLGSVQGLSVKEKIFALVWVAEGSDDHPPHRVVYLSSPDRILDALPRCAKKMYIHEQLREHLDEAHPRWVSDRVLEVVEVTKRQKIPHWGHIAEECSNLLSGGNVLGRDHRALQIKCLLPLAARLYELRKNFGARARWLSFAMQHSKGRGVGELARLSQHAAFRRAQEEQQQQQRPGSKSQPQSKQDMCEKFILTAIGRKRQSWEQLEEAEEAGDAALMRDGKISRAIDGAAVFIGAGDFDEASPE